jgi:hypothetical protein
MKKLEDIPKKEIFSVPDGYFERLPSILQSRLAEHHQPSWKTSPVFRYSVRFAIPVLVLLAAGIFWYTRQLGGTDAEMILASVETEDLMVYLQESDLSTEELMDHLPLDADDADDIQDAVYELNFGDNELEEIIDDVDLNRL